MECVIGFVAIAAFAYFLAYVAMVDNKPESNPERKMSVAEEEDDE